MQEIHERERELQCYSRRWEEKPCSLREMVLESTVYTRPSLFCLKK